MLIRCSLSLLLLQGVIQPVICVHWWIWSLLLLARMGLSRSLPFQWNWNKRGNTWGMKALSYCYPPTPTEVKGEGYHIMTSTRLSLTHSPFFPQCLSYLLLVETSLNGQANERALICEWQIFLCAPACFVLKGLDSWMRDMHHMRVWMEGLQ